MMRWLLRKVDALCGTIIAAVAGLAASQSLAFIQQYVQRLGGHLDEAKLQLRNILEGAAYREVDAATKDRFADATLNRIAELSEAHEAIKGAGPLMKPVQFLAKLDPDIALATWTNFQPALPLDMPSLIIAAAGMVAAWLIYELVKLPFAAMLRRATRSQPAPDAAK